MLHGIRQRVSTGERDDTVIQLCCVMKWLDVEAVARSSSDDAGSGAPLGTNCEACIVWAMLHGDERR